MSEENKSIWNQCHKPPQTALKQITGGRLSGMTDINPQWRLEIMTEMFGPCGTGWGYTIDKLWREDGSDGQVMAFALVTVWYDNGGANAKIQGIGGSMLITNEKSGAHTSDEGYKMAVTDALSVALKALGVGAEIYAGRWDGSKYKEKEKPEKDGKKIGNIDDVKKLLENANTIEKIDNISKMCNQYYWDEKNIDILKKIFLEKRESIKNGVKQ